MTAFRHAWRNIWRNGKRTAITVLAVTLNTAILITTYALMRGMLIDMVNNATNLVTGDAQVHAQEYRADRSIYKAISNPDRIVAEAEKLGVAASRRSYGYGLISSGPKSSGALFWGLDPQAERATSKLPSEIFKGRYLADTRTGEVVLGRKLAKSLQAEVGSEVVTVVQAADGSLGNELFKVVGIFNLAGESIDRMAAVLHREDFEALFVSGGRIHEIALSAHGSMPSEEVAQRMERAAGNAEVRTWKQLMPALAGIVELMSAGLWLFGAIFFLAAGLGVMNTMLMATYERIREFGIIKAIGATPLRIVRDVATEAFVLAIVSTVFGTLLGVAGAVYCQEVGIDLRWFVSGDLSFSGVAFNPIWRAALDVNGVIWPVLVMWMISVLSALYPAIKAARLDPVRAITHV